jgi:hypothetical protein
MARRLACILLVPALMYALVALGFGAKSVIAPSPEDVPNRFGNLRGVYLDSGTEGSVQTGVGRLTLQLLNGVKAREVSRHHRFRSGDRFRFLISSNREGWLYVLHRSEESPARLLWPPPAGVPVDPGSSANWLRPRTATPVPTPPAVFVFDDEIGNEYFFVAILQEPHPPILSAMEAPEKKEPSAVPTRPVAPLSSPETLQAQETERLRPETEPRIVQFSVRGSAGGASIPSRGVFLDPSPQGSDPATYFSVLPRDLEGGLVFEFKLRHEH